VAASRDEPSAAERKRNNLQGFNDDFMYSSSSQGQTLALIFLNVPSLPDSGEDNASPLQRESQAQHRDSRSQPPKLRIMNPQPSTPNPQRVLEVKTCRECEAPDRSRRCEHHFVCLKWWGKVWTLKRVPSTRRECQAADCDGRRGCRARHLQVEPALSLSPRCIFQIP
jgi:hypothetical protein